MWQMNSFKGIWTCPYELYFCNLFHTILISIMFHDWNNIIIFCNDLHVHMMLRQLLLLKTFGIILRYLI